MFIGPSNPSGIGVSNIIRDFIGSPSYPFANKMSLPLMSEVLGLFKDIVRVVVIHQKDIKL